MLRTILLLDGSEAMNSSSDYLPSYLLALRTPLLRFVSQYLDHTPLASLGVVVMRDGVSTRLCACTTNAREVVDVLERDYFLYGGVGSLSLENGLRMALAELVQLKRTTSRAKASSGNTDSDHQQQQQQRGSRARLAGLTAAVGGGVRPRVVLLSASVTLVDPTDVLQVVRLLARCGVVVDIVSFAGAVHVFEECTRQTHGRLCCPLSYDHVLRIMRELTFSSNSNSNNSSMRTSRGGGVRMLPIGFPLALPRCTATSSTTTTTTTAADSRHSGDASGARRVEYYLACPQCHLLQTAVPSTCALCKLLLCAVVLMYATYVSHNALLPPSRPRHVRSSSSSKSEKDKDNDVAAPPQQQQQQPRECERCSLCNDVLPRIDTSRSSAASASTAGTLPTASSSDGNGTTTPTAASDAAAVRWRCVACRAVRCAACQLYLSETLRLCPLCIALR